MCVCVCVWQRLRALRRVSKDLLVRILLCSAMVSFGLAYLGDGAAEEGLTARPSSPPLLAQGAAACGCARATCCDIGPYRPRICARSGAHRLHPDLAVVPPDFSRTRSSRKGGFLTAHTSDGSSLALSSCDF